MMSTGGLPALFQGSPDLFLFKATARMEPADAETFWRQLMEAANRRLYRTIMRAPPSTARAAALYDTARYASLGLEREAEEDPERAARLAARIGASALAKTGFEIITRLAQMAEETEAELQMPPPMEDGSYLNAVEQHRLTQLLKGRVAFRSLPPDMRPLEAPRPVASLSDARFALEALLCFKARAALFEAFPQAPLRKALQRGAAADEAVDLALVNGAVYPADGIDFETNKTAFYRFQTMETDEARRRLTTWLRQLLNALDADTETIERIRRYLEYRADRLLKSV